MVKVADGRSSSGDTFKSINWEEKDELMTGPSGKEEEAVSSGSNNNDFFGKVCTMSEDVTLGTELSGVTTVCLSPNAPSEKSFVFLLVFVVGLGKGRFLVWLSSS